MKKIPVNCFSVFMAVALLAAIFPTPARGQLAITSFGANGQLTWNDPSATGTNNYAVEWASSLNGSWSSWKDAETRLMGLGASGTVNVPMFYRVVATDPTNAATQRYTYFQELPPFDPLTPLETNEMRITFMGSMIPLPVRRAQGEMSIFVEVGWSNDVQDLVYKGRPIDQFIFDMGAGVSGNYAAAKVGYRKMDKVFINHLHGDHISDLIHTYCFGPAGDRKSPLFVWGSGPSGVDNPSAPGTTYNDGTYEFCRNLRETLRWHTESFSFQSTSYSNYVAPTQVSWGLPHEPVPVGSDTNNDAYAIVPIELDWEQVGGVAYNNAATGAKVTHFPVIHCRKGSMGYKLVWRTPDGYDLSMIYTSDTKPETNCIEQAKNDGNGVDVFIHEMVVPPEVWAYKNMGLDRAPLEGEPRYYEYLATVDGMTTVQNSSHTTQGAFGYLLSQIDPKPKLTVATHFPVADDTVASAFQSVTNHCPEVVMGRDLIWSFDLMVLRVFPGGRIEQRRAAVSDYSFNPPVQMPGGLTTPKYNDGKGKGDPFAQIDTSAQIAPTNTDGSVNYRIDGF